MGNVGRRGLFRTLRSQRESRPSGPKRRRPPGAVPESDFLAGCTACGDCVVACPHNAIHTLAEWVEPGAHTPVMVPENRPCHMCEGFPCAQACPEGVLKVPETPAVKLGEAVIDPTRCLPYIGPECGACAGLCPSGVDALRIKADLPVLDGDACVGCGLCIGACPTRPAAIEMVPLERMT